MSVPLFCFFGNKVIPRALSDRSPLPSNETSLDDRASVETWLVLVPIVFSNCVSESDFTHLTDLGVSIAGEEFPHLLYHFVLRYSNWETGTICYSGSFASLSEGLQQALWELGGVPVLHRTDRMTAAINNLTELADFQRNDQALMRHYGMEGGRSKPGGPMRTAM